MVRDDFLDDGRPVDWVWLRRRRRRGLRRRLSWWWLGGRSVLFALTDDDLLTLEVFLGWWRRRRSFTTHNPFFALAANEIASALRSLPRRRGAAFVSIDVNVDVNVQVSTIIAASIPGWRRSMLVDVDLFTIVRTSGWRRPRSLPADFPSRVAKLLSIIVPRRRCSRSLPADFPMSEGELFTLVIPRGRRARPLSTAAPLSPGEGELLAIDFCPWWRSGRCGRRRRWSVTSSSSKSNLLKIFIPVVSTGRHPFRFLLLLEPNLGLFVVPTAPCGRWWSGPRISKGNFLPIIVAAALTPRVGRASALAVSLAESEFFLLHPLRWSRWPAWPDTLHAPSTCGSSAHVIVVPSVFSHHQWAGVGVAAVVFAQEIRLPGRWPLAPTSLADDSVCVPLLHHGRGRSPRRWGSIVARSGIIVVVVVAPAGDVGAAVVVAIVDVARHG